MIQLMNILTCLDQLKNEVILISKCIMAVPPIWSARCKHRVPVLLSLSKDDLKEMKEG